MDCTDKGRSRKWEEEEDDDEEEVEADEEEREREKKNNNREIKSCPLKMWIHFSQLVFYNSVLCARFARALCGVMHRTALDGVSFPFVQRVGTDGTGRDDWTVRDKCDVNATELSNFSREKKNQKF